jgi:uncharacterized repeat protein (TIGR04076 family)
MAGLVIRVREIRGHCPVHSPGDEIIIAGPRIDLEKTHNICIHALSPILHYAVALREGVDPERLGLTKKGKMAYIHCPDPGESHNRGGEVIFEIERTED